MFPISCFSGQRAAACETPAGAHPQSLADTSHVCYAPLRHQYVDLPFTRGSSSLPLQPPRCFMIIGVLRSRTLILVNRTRFTPFTISASTVPALWPFGRVRSLFVIHCRRLLPSGKGIHESGESLSYNSWLEAFFRSYSYTLQFPQSIETINSSPCSQRA